MLLKWDDACGVYQTPSVASGHVMKERPESLKIVQNLKFSSASVISIVTFEPENRVWGNEEHRVLRLLDELNCVTGADFSHLVCARCGAWCSAICENRPKSGIFVGQCHVHNHFLAWKPGLRERRASSFKTFRRAWSCGRVRFFTSRLCYAWCRAFGNIPKSSDTFWYPLIISPDLHIEWPPILRRLTKRFGCW